MYSLSLSITYPYKIQLNRRGNSVDDATPIFTSDSRSSVLGLSNEVYNFLVAQKV